MPAISLDLDPASEVGARIRPLAVAGLAAAAVAAWVLLVWLFTVEFRPASPIALGLGAVGIGAVGLVGFRRAGRRGRLHFQRIRAVAEALPIPVLLTSLDHSTVLFASERARQQFGLPEAGGADGGAGSSGDGRHASAAPIAVPPFYARPQDHALVLDLLRRHGEVHNHTVELRRLDGSTFWALAAARIMPLGDEPGIIVSFSDVSERKAAEEALLASEVRYALISRASNDGIWDWDLPSGAVYYSARWKEIAGIAPGDKVRSAEDWFSRVHPDDLARLCQAIEDNQAGRSPQLDIEYRLRRGDGAYAWMQCRGITLRNGEGEPIRMAGSQSDVTLRKTYENNLLNAAYEDRLTGIHNRAYFTQLVDGRNDPAGIEAAAIVLFDVDQFRRLNDNLGAGAGDALLIGIARRLAAEAGEGEVLARLGGNEFAAWLQIPGAGSGPATTELHLRRADRLIEALEQPYALGDVEVPVAFSIGLAVAGRGSAQNGAELLRNARLALDRAKLAADGRVHLFDDSLLRETELRRRLSRDLTVTGRQGQIRFEYQPIVALSEPAGSPSFPIRGVEALIRWDHAELGAISPARFIPIAEEAGLIGSLGLDALEAAAAVLATWSKRGLIDPAFAVSVNLSARQISDRAGVARLLGMLDRLALPPGSIKLEITESVLMSDPEAMAGTLRALRERGIGLCLDDFGTGYSSLSYLHRFPLDTLKIDRSFIARMTVAPEAYRLVRSIVELAHDLGLTVVAEGVESSAEVDMLRRLHCDYAQGYFFSRPLRPEAVATLLEAKFL